MKMKLRPRGMIPLDWIGYTGTRARKGTVLRYTVSGRGHFPADMLRYDDAEILGQPEPTERLTEVTEFRISGMGCTPERWRSFGWTVVPASVVEVFP